IPTETMFVAVRTAGVFLVLTATVLGGGLASAQLYRDSMPGEMLYGVKVAIEKTQLLLSPNDEYRVSLHAEFADRRVNEVAWLAELPVYDKQLVAETLFAFEKDVVALRGGLQNLATDDPTNAVEMAKSVERKMTLYHNILQKAAANLTPDVRMAVNATRNRIDETAISAMAIIVQGHLEGDERAPRMIVLNKFEDRIKQAEHSLDTVIAEREIYEEKSPAIKAKTAIAEAKLLIEKENYQAALLKIAEVAELTKEAEEEAAQEAQDAENVEAEATVEVENKNVEGDQAVDSVVSSETNETLEDAIQADH
ncbi:hypothetical protein KKE28_05290, partial [Patescibacteria group bacterium]|nr:hypothetical protein [Patescibacteria group bacterium]